MTTQPIHYLPRAGAADSQESLPTRYPLWVQGLSMVAFTVAFLGWLNESWLFLFENPIWLNRYTEYAIIAAFGVWRIIAEKNPYTRKRLTVLVVAVTVLWWLIPWLLPTSEPYVGYQWGQPVFPSLHVPGTITFFVVLGAVFLFGRRVICGWNCPCVGVRETVGFAFRDRTLRGPWAWALRHTKWLFFIFYAGVIVVTLYPPNAWTVSFVGLFYLIVVLTYFGSFFVAPITGNRFYCRYLCPYGATFGLLNHAGFYGIEMDTARCVDCRRCEQVCDMGIPVWAQGKASGRVTGIEDCMGCARCVVSCPSEALEIRDVRNLLRPAMRQDAGHLLGTPLPAPTPRFEPLTRPAAARLDDWGEGSPALTAAQARAAAARCLDCGVPGCRNACPLANRIPDWLRAVARGESREAAAILQSTSALPEVCGRLCPQHRLCEQGCTRNGSAEGLKNGAVTIAALERWVAAGAMEHPVVAAAPNGRRVAVVGSGPAGLACAERLARDGVAVTVYERNAVVGGLLASGVPAFKLEKSLLARRVERLAAMGIEFWTETTVDEALFTRLLEENEALFIGSGAQRPRELRLPGRELNGVRQALDFLAAVNAGEPPELSGRRVVVLGGGDSAMDCARAARRLGAEAVVAYRGPSPAMRASPKELTAAREEGVEILYAHRPEAFEGEEGTLARVRFDNEAVEPCDLAILAIGQRPAPPPWLARFGIATDERGRIVVDARGRTANPKVYAGGDNTRGPDLVVTAMAAGRLAAEGMLTTFSLGGRLRGGAKRLMGRREPIPSVAAMARAEEGTA